jgi:hypothetical protein
MNKNTRQPKPVTQQQKQIESPLEKTPAESSTPRKITILPHRHCPICWGRCGGYGTSYSKQGGKTYYRCDQTTNNEFPPCGHTWSVVLKVEAVSIEHRIVDMDSER